VATGRQVRALRDDRTDLETENAVLNICKGKKCGAAFSVGATTCPQCGGTDFTVDHPSATAEPIQAVGEQGPELVVIPAGSEVAPTP
jgi:ribosomal protein L40E